MTMRKHLSVAICTSLLTGASIGAEASFFFQSHAGATNERADRLGWAVASGDFNADGFTDLAVSSPWEDTGGARDTGMVVVFYGTLQGLSATGAERITQSSVVTATNEDGDRFGYALAVGDFDGDEFDDLAVGVPFEDTGGANDTGMVAILFGSSRGLLPSNSEAITQNSVVTATNESGDHFGFSLAAGNLDGDAFDDLAIGVPLENTDGAANTGMVAVLFGSENGLLPSRSEAITQNSVVTATNENGDQFGYSLAIGNFDGDAFQDLAVGVPFEDTGGATDTGLVAVLFGSESGLLPSRSEAFTQNSIVTATNENGDRLGHALAVGNFDGDSYDDLAVSAPYENTDGARATGLIAVMFGSRNGLLPSRSEAFTQRSAYETNERGDLAGFSLVTGRLDEDPFDDLIVGVPFENEGRVDNGKVLALFGTESGLLPPRSYPLQQSFFGGAEEHRDRFGFSLASGDFDGNGVDELAVGVPYEDAGRVRDAGTVFFGEIEAGLPVITGDAAIVFDRFTGKVLGAKLPDARLANASTTKMMTAFLAVEAVRAGEIALDDPVTVLAGNDAVTVGGSCMRTSNTQCPNNGGTGGLQVGDTLSVQDLLYGVMLRSGNEAANTLAAHVGGSVPAFVDRMNQRAQELGLRDTSFVTPHGRDPEDVFPNDCDGNEFDKPECAHFSTARDLARLANLGLSDPLFAQVVGADGFVTSDWVNGNGASRNGRLCNTNRLVRDGSICSSSPSAFPGAYGVKTGTTDRAGSCLVSAARRRTVFLGTKDVVAVVLGANTNDSPGGDRYSDSTTLLNFGLARATTKPPVIFVPDD